MDVTRLPRFPVLFRFPANQDDDFFLAPRSFFLQDTEIDEAGLLFDDAFACEPFNHRLGMTGFHADCFKLNKQKNHSSLIDNDSHLQHYYIIDPVPFVNTIPICFHR